MSLLKECPRDPERFMLRSQPERCVGMCTVLPLAFLLHLSVAWCIAAIRWLLEQERACTFRIRSRRTAIQPAPNSLHFTVNLPSKSTFLCFFENLESFSMPGNASEPLHSPSPGDFRPLRYQLAGGPVVSCNSQQSPAGQRSFWGFLNSDESVHEPEQP